MEGLANKSVRQPELCLATKSHSSATGGRPSTASGEVHKTTSDHQQLGNPEGPFQRLNQLKKITVFQNIVFPPLPIEESEGTHSGWQIRWRRGRVARRSFQDDPEPNATRVGRTVPGYRRRQFIPFLKIHHDNIMDELDNSQAKTG